MLSPTNCGLFLDDSNMILTQEEKEQLEREVTPEEREELMKTVERLLKKHESPRR